MINKKQLLGLFIPVLIETFSMSLLGVIHGIMLSHVDQYAMSAANIVNAFNNVVMNVFVAVSTGVTVKVSQYIGQKRICDAQKCSEQSILLEILLSLGVMAAIIIFGKQLISFMFGSADTRILSAASIYLIANAVSYPSFAVFSVCNSVFRGAGEYRITLFSGIIINALNAGLAAIFIFGYGMGILGAGLSLILSRTICGILLWVWLRRGTNLIQIGVYLSKIKRETALSVLRISIPAGIDAMVSNGGRLIVQTFIVGMGTSMIAADAIANNIAGFILVPGNAVAVMAVTIIGQSFGDGDLKRTRRYMWNILWGSNGLMLIICILGWIFLNPVVSLYNPNEEVAYITRRLLHIVLLTYPLLWSFSFVSTPVLRGTGDVKYATTVSIMSMWGIRVLLAWFFGVILKMGIYGVWFAMVSDWIVRIIFLIPRIMSDKWERLDRI